MLRQLRIALLLVIAFLMIGTVVIGLGSDITGPVEKIAFVAFGTIARRGLPSEFTRPARPPSVFDFELASHSVLVAGGAWLGRRRSIESESHP